MRLRDVLLIVLSIVVYGVLAYGAVYYLPEVIPQAAQVRALPGGATKAALVENEEQSVRSSAVTLLTGSALGAAGLVAFLTFGTGRRDAERNVRKSQDELFMNALNMVGSEDVPVAAGAISILGSVAHERVDLRDAAAAALFAVARRGIRLSSPLDYNSTDDRNVDRLADRETLAASALRILGRGSVAYVGGGAGVVVDRRLDGSDLRRWEISGARYEIVTFSGSYFWDAAFIDCEFIKCSFAQADWSGAKLRRVRFVECDLSFSNLTSAVGSDVQMDRCKGLEDIQIPNWMTVTNHR